MCNAFEQVKKVMITGPSTLHPTKRVADFVSAKYCIWLVLLFIHCSYNVLFSAKTDVILLHNGDKITCEVKELRSGKLRVKTDDMGTIYIEWDKIASVSTAEKYEVELQFGAIYYGVIGPSQDPRKLSVISDSLTYDVFRRFVVHITPIKDTFIDRIDGSINFGVDYTKASDVLRYNANGDATHRSLSNQVEVKFNSMLTKQQDITSSNKNDITLYYTRILGNRWAWGLVGALEQNTELNLDLRSTLGGGAGHTIYQSISMEWHIYTGLNGTRELVREREAQFNLELPIRTRFDMFVYNNPKTDIKTILSVFPSITTKDRYRIELDSKLKYELFVDFNLTFNVYASYDSKPPNATSAKNDYGVTLSFGYTF
jgi:hypothetical protein